jgi:hypothetical protein
VLLLPLGTDTSVGPSITIHTVNSGHQTIWQYGALTVYFTATKRLKATSTRPVNFYKPGGGKIIHLKYVNITFPCILFLECIVFCV